MKEIKIGPGLLLYGFYMHKNSSPFYKFIRKNKDCVILELLEIRFAIKIN